MHLTAKICVLEKEMSSWMFIGLLTTHLSTSILTEVLGFNWRFPITNIEESAIHINDIPLFYRVTHKSSLLIDEATSTGIVSLPLDHSL